MSKKRSKFNDTEVAEVEVETSILPPVDDAVLLKVDHTHAGKKFVAGTPLDELDASDSSVAYMKEHNIV